MFTSLINNRNKIYWICQISGWSTYLVINFILLVLFQGFDWRKLLIFVFLGYMGISFTHIYRLIIRKWKWNDVPLLKLVLRVVTGALVISFISSTILFLIVRKTGVFPPEKMGFAQFFGNFFNFTIIMLLWSLIYVSVHFLENFRASEIERLVWEAAVKDFELKTLKSQLNPHFMFNALNSIRALIEENPEYAKKAITQLSNIFRYSLKIERTETVPLEEEMKTVTDYLSLEQIRYEERLKSDIFYSNDCKSLEVPPMMIQTLVENGIKHGISKKAEGGYVGVRAERQNNTLHIEITNSGVVEQEEVDNAKGFGISNTRQRLHLLYGTRASFRLFNDNGFVKAEIIIHYNGDNR